MGIFRYQLQSFFLALSFLTIIPSQGNRIATEKEMADSLYYYPVVGGIIGLILASFSFLANIIGLGIGGEALVVVLWIILTGGLHGDGLMDTADGVFSGKERPKMLEIMRDSRVGAMGVIAFGSIFLLKFSFLASLPVDIKLWALLVAPILGRAMMVYAVLYYPYARSGAGLGKSFGSHAKSNMVFMSVIIVVLISMLASASAPLYSLVIVGFSALAAGIFAHWLAGVVGGQTGDTYGAVCEVSETILIMIAVIGLAGFYG